MGREFHFVSIDDPEVDLNPERFGIFVVGAEGNGYLVALYDPEMPFDVAAATFCMMTGGEGVFGASERAVNAGLFETAEEAPKLEIVTVD